MDYRKVPPLQPSEPKENNEALTVQKDNNKVVKVPVDTKEVISSILFQIDRDINFDSKAVTLPEKLACGLGIGSIYGVTAFFAWPPLYYSFSRTISIAYISFIGTLLYNRFNERSPRYYHYYVREIQILPDLQSVIIYYDLIDEKQIVLTFEKLQKRTELLLDENKVVALRLKVADPTQHGEVLDLRLSFNEEFTKFTKFDRLDIFLRISQGETEILNKMQVNFLDAQKGEGRSKRENVESEDDEY